MLRVWVTSGIGVGVVVAAILYITRQEPVGAHEGRTIRPPAPLADKEVRDYIAILPQENAILGNAAWLFQEWRKENPGKPDSEVPDLGRDGMETMLRRHHMSIADWGRLRSRVEYVVEAVRWDLDKQDRDRRREAKIEETKGQIETAQKNRDAAIVEKLEKVLADLIATRGDTGYPVAGQDKVLVKRYWQDLDRMAPKSDPTRRGR